MLSTHYTLDKTLDICPLIVKKLFLYNKYDYLITQFLPSLPYKTKGLYFNTLQTGPKSLVARHMPQNKGHGNQLYIFNDENKKKESVVPYNKKEKIVTNEEVNDDSKKVFKIVKTNQTEIYDIYCKNDTEKLYKHNVACIPNLKTSKFMKKLLNDKLSTLVYCKFHEKFKKWEPISLCPDSFNENDISCLKDITPIES